MRMLTKNSTKSNNKLYEVQCNKISKAETINGSCVFVFKEQDSLEWQFPSIQSNQVEIYHTKSGNYYKTVFLRKQVLVFEIACQWCTTENTLLYVISSRKYWKSYSYFPRFSIEICRFPITNQQFCRNNSVICLHQMSLLSMYRYI